jgi:hypothetical protein
MSIYDEKIINNSIIKNTPSEKNPKAYVNAWYLLYLMELVHSFNCFSSEITIRSHG